MNKRQFESLNARRVALITKDLEGRLSREERRELEHLEQVVGQWIDERFPLPEVDLEKLDELEKRLKRKYRR